MAAEKLTRLFRQLALFGMLGSLLSLAGIFGRHYWVLDLLSHFRVQYIVLGLFALCFALLGRARLSSLIIALCLAVHVVEVTRLIYPWQLLFGPLTVDVDETDSGQSQRIRVMSSNLLASNSNYTPHLEFINKVNPDVIVFQEYTPAWDQFLSTALDSYPYQLREPEHGSFGMAAYSKHAFINSNPSIDTTFYSRGISFSIFVGELPVEIYGMHPPPPMSPEWYNERNRQLGALAKMLDAGNSTYVVMGDLNITPWSGHYKDFTRFGNLKDGRKGMGILATWPASVFPLLIPIDHILVSTEIDVTWMNTSKGMNSDHHAIWADLELMPASQ